MNTTPYQFALVGTPGKGKTMAFRNLDPKTTGFINAECKPLPFINNFEKYSTPNNWQETYQKLIEFAKDDSIETVVLDSFSAYVDSLLKTARETKRGFDIWSYYSEEIGKLLFMIKKYPKNIVVTAHYEWVETEEGAVEKRISIKGREWKGLIEKDFTIVQFAEVQIIDNKRVYSIVLNTDGKTSAKTPPMFLNEGEEKIPNDYVMFLKRVKERLNK